MSKFSRISPEHKPTDNGQKQPDHGDAYDGSATPDAGTAPDPFDPERLRVDQEFELSRGLRKVLNKVAVRKPHRSKFIRTHPKDRVTTGVIEIKEDRDALYLIAPELRNELSTDAAYRLKMLVVTIDRQGTVFVWPLNLPRADGRTDDWSRTALEAAEMATHQWVRVTANMDNGCYDVEPAIAQLPEPEWPDHSFKDLLRVAFRGNYIETIDHTILRQLRGEV
jgi:hypothetical protein